MSCRLRVLAVGLGLTLAACSADDPTVTAPALPPVAPPPDQPPPAPPSLAQDRIRHERLALRMAQALRDPGFRQAVWRAIDASRYREQKIHLQAFLDADGGLQRGRLAALSLAPEAAVVKDLNEAPTLEFYLPVPEHRRRWQGGTDVLVATAELDGDAPVAYDLMGRRQRLSPDTPPDLPVLMVSRAELRFDAGPLGIECLADCGGTGGGGSYTGPPAAGLFLTQTRFNGTYESWFKGSPEFEIHVLGRDGASSKLRTLQCAGEHAGGPYYFDQQSEAWTGSVMLFSQAQLDQYKAIYPGEALRILALEDDDGACVIKVDSTRVTKMLQQLNAAYGGFTGGIDAKDSFLRKIFKAAPILYTVYAALANWFLTNDDLIGNAVADSSAAAAFFNGANWVVKGENSVANGGLRLEMR